MRNSFLLSAVILLAVSISEVQAADVIVRNVNLGECTTYSDGCNTHTTVPTRTTEAGFIGANRL